MTTVALTSIEIIKFGFSFFNFKDRFSKNLARYLEVGKLVSVKYSKSIFIPSRSYCLIRVNNSPVNLFVAGLLLIILSIVVLSKDLMDSKTFVPLPEASFLISAT